MIDSEILTTSITVIGAIAGTLATLGRWFFRSINRLNCRIDELAQSISSLDKSLAVHTAVFENFCRRNSK